MQKIKLITGKYYKCKQDLFMIGSGIKCFTKGKSYLLRNFDSEKKITFIDDLNNRHNVGYVDNNIILKYDEYWIRYFEINYRTEKLKRILNEN